MSRFLAPIHFWLFNKISYHEDLELELKNTLEKKFGSEVTNLLRSLEDEFGEIISDKDLASIIDQQNIHGWLANAIATAEKRQARFIAIVIEKYGNYAYSILEDVHRAVGEKYGALAKESLGSQISAPEIYKILNDYILDGMPCDNVRQLVSSESDHLTYIQFECLHAPYWDSVDLDGDTMYKLRAEYIDGFVSSLSGSYSYRFDKSYVDGRLTLKHDIYKK